MEDLGVDGKERNYRKELRSMEVDIKDIRVLLMAVMRLNDGKTFVDSAEAPLPQSEGELGFRDQKTGAFALRTDELPRLHKHFNALYVN